MPSSSPGDVYLVVFQPALRERRWYGTPARGVMSIGSALEGDVQLTGHNIAARHVRLHFGSKDRVQIEVRSPYGVRVDGKVPRALQSIARESVIEIGPWAMKLDSEPPSGIEAIDESFLADPDADARLVYADSLEERGRLAEAELVRGVRGRADVASLAVRTPPVWRRRLLPMAIEACANASCPGSWGALADDGDATSRACGTCGRRVSAVANLGAARALALRGRPVAIDPAVTRWSNDLREPVVKRPAIDMGQPTRRGIL